MSNQFGPFTFENPFYELNQTLKELSDSIKAITSCIPSSIKTPTLSFPVSSRLEFISDVNEIKWPLFLEHDEKFINGFINIYNRFINEETDLESLEGYIFNYYNKNQLNKIYLRWLDCSFLNSSKLPIFKEAIELYFVEKFYASTALLICQVDGLIIDTIKCLNDSKHEISYEIKESIVDYYNINKNGANKIDDVFKTSSKNKLRLLSAIPTSGFLVWDASIDYLISTILSSTDSKNIRAHHPQRNKICHGTQLNFGTREHSLKAILCIDILVQLLELVNDVCNDDK